MHRGIRQAQGDPFEKHLASQVSFNLLYLKAYPCESGETVETANDGTRPLRCTGEPRQAGHARDQSRENH
jgi:hypothetical protein